MRVEVLYFEGCPNHAATAALVRDVIRELHLDVQVEEIEVKSPADANRLRFLGSPSVHVDGVDVEPAARRSTAYAYGCRVYGQAAMPSRDMVREALLAARNGTLTTSASRTDRAGLLAGSGAVVAALLASACCLGPLALITAGVSVAGVSAAFEPLRPLFLGLTTVLLGGALYFTYVRKPVCDSGAACAALNPRRRRFNRLMLSMATAMVGMLALFPVYAGSVYRAVAPVALAGDQTSSVTLRIEGMTCAACAAHVESVLVALPGVRAASVSSNEGRAAVRVDAVSPPSTETLIQAVEKAGYQARLVH